MAGLSPSRVTSRTLRGTRVADALMMGTIVVVLAAYYVVSVSRLSVSINGQLYPTFGDDAYISMRYAHHLAEGDGLVWNVGEAPVEGYTNFLWVVWIAGLTLLARDPSYLMSASAAAFHIGSVLLLYGFLRGAVRAGLFVAGGAAFLLMSWAPIRTQVLYGSEQPMLLFLLVAGVCCLFHSRVSGRRALVGAFLAGLLPLVRPDGWFFAIALLVGFAWENLPPAGMTHGHPPWKWVVLLALGPGTLLVLFRVLYFGDWLPNTYYLKVLSRPGRVGYGVDYVKRFLQDFYATWLIVPLSAYSLLENRRGVTVAGFVPIGVLVYVAYQGGDAWDWWRFMVPILPCLLLVLACFTDRARAIRPVYGAVLGIWTTVLSLGLISISSQVAAGDLFPVPSLETADNIRLGLLLSRVCRSEALTADFWAGATPYYSGLSSVDMLGKSDRHIARVPAYKPGAPPGHDKFDFDYVMSLRPDVVVSNHPLRLTQLEIAAIRAGEFPFGALLLENEEFKRQYVPVASLISNRWHGIFSRRDSAACDWSRLPIEELRLLDSRCLAVIDGWYALEDDDLSHWRWTSGRGVLRVTVPETTTLRIDGGIASIALPNRVDVVANGETQRTLSITRAGWTPFQSISLELMAGTNIIEFVSDNPATVIPTDNRPLAIAVNNLTLTLADGDAASCMVWP